MDITKKDVFLELKSAISICTAAKDQKRAAIYRKVLAIIKADEELIASADDVMNQYEQSIMAQLSPPLLGPDLHASIRVLLPLSIEKAKKARQ